MTSQLSDYSAIVAHWAAERPHEGYRRLKRKLEPRASDLLAAAVVSLQPEALYAALQAEIALFRELRVIVLDRYKLTIDPKPGRSSRTRYAGAE